MAKVIAATTLSPTVFVPGFPIESTNIRAVARSLNDARANRIVNYINVSSGNASQIRPGGLAFIDSDHTVNTYATVYSGQIFIDADIENIASRVRCVGNGSVFPFQIESTIGGSVATFNGGLSGDTAELASWIHEVQPSIAPIEGVTGTGWVNFQLRLRFTSGVAQGYYLKSWTVHSLPLVASDLGDP